MKDRNTKFQWYMVPSFLFFVMLMLCFVWSIIDGIHHAMVNAAYPACTGECDSTDEGNPDQ